MAETAIYLNLIALIPPAVGLVLLLKRKADFHEVKTATAAQATIYFMSAVAFDILTNIGVALAALGTLISVYLLLFSGGFLAATLCLSPESRSMKESLSKVLRSMSFQAYQLTLLGWLITTLYLQSSFLPTNIALWAAAAFYPTTMFFLAKKRAKAAHIRDMLTILYTTWLILGLAALPTILFATGPPALGITLPFGYQVAFLTSSFFFYLMALAMTDPTGLTRLWMSRLVPQTIIELGRRYLILHDAGNRTLSFLSNTFRNLVASGGKIVLKGRRSPLIETLALTEPKFDEWVRSGRLLNMTETETSNTGLMKAISEKVSFGATSTIYVRALWPEDMLATTSSVGEEAREKGPMFSELFLLESSRVPRPQLGEFLRRNGDIQMVNLSEPKDYFSSLVNLQHDQTLGAKILLEYDSTADLGIVEKFFIEGMGYAERCVLFTSKSSKLYRAIKGKELVKIVAASSLVSVPDELADGEVQIPDRELGLVASIASDLLENNRNTAVRFVFESMEELIRGDRWEQLYSGVKQLVELVSVPHATALFLINIGTTEPRFLGALRALFSVQLRLDSSGLQVKKL